MTISTTPAALATHFTALNEIVHRDGGGAATPTLVALAVEVVPGCDWSAVTAWPQRRHPLVLASSHEIAARVDTVQDEHAGGACLTATRERETVRVDDLDHEPRWPGLARQVVDRTPVRAVLSFHLSDEPVRTALNLYSGSPDWDPDAVDTAAVFAAHARVLLMHAAVTDQRDNLSTALTTSRQIGAAVGILMSLHRITEDAAFALLRDVSQHTNRKLRDVADDVTLTGALPRV